MTAKPQKASKATGRLKGMVTFLDGLKPEEAQAVLQRFLAAHPDLCAEVLPSPPPKGAEWIEAYRRWAGHSS